MEEKITYIKERDVMKKAVFMAVAVFLTLAAPMTLFAETGVMPYPAEKIVDAIYLAEGAGKAQFLYGIRSISYDTPQEARRYCKNTVLNQYKRHQKHVCGLTYMECLARRYCPINCDNDTGTNQFWLKNVMYFLTK